MGSPTVPWTPSASPPPTFEAVVHLLIPAATPPATLRPSLRRYSITLIQHPASGFRSTRWHKAAQMDADASFTGPPHVPHHLTGHDVQTRHEVGSQLLRPVARQQRCRSCRCPRRRCGAAPGQPRRSRRPVPGATSPFQTFPLAACRRLRYHPIAIAAPMATPNIPTVNGSVIMIISPLASGLAPATVTPNMDWLITARIRTAHPPAVVQTVLRTMEFDMAAPAQIGLADCPQIIKYSHS